MEYREFSAKNVDDAITEACETLMVTSDRLDYEVVSSGSAGFLGIAAKPAVIKARIKEEVQEAEPVVEAKTESKADNKKPSDKPNKEEARKELEVQLDKTQKMLIELDDKIAKVKEFYEPKEDKKGGAK